ncbi:MAG: hypothetical protein KUG56_05280 [Kordiimonadaceae bacterium]|nr:hypothetical protein [Kordiimonadaceae bacterium]
MAAAKSTRTSIRQLADTIITPAKLWLACHHHNPAPAQHLPQLRNARTEPRWATLDPLDHTGPHATLAAKNYGHISQPYFSRTFTPKSRHQKRASKRSAPTAQAPTTEQATF